MLAQEVGLRHEVGVEDRDSSPFAVFIPSSSAPALYPRAVVRWM